MPLSATIIQKIEAASYSLDLRSQNLTDADIPELLALLVRFPGIQNLDLRNNKIGARGVQLLATNTSLLSLRLKEGNNISVQDLQPFLQNTTIREFTIIGGSGSALTNLRQHFANNKARYYAAIVATQNQAVATSSNSNTSAVAASTEQSIAVKKEEKLELTVANSSTSAAPVASTQQPIAVKEEKLELTVANSSTSAAPVASSAVSTYLPPKNSGFLFLDDIPVGNYVIGNQPMKTSGDIYHILVYLTFAKRFGFQMPAVVLAYDNEETQKQSQRAFGLAKALGFENFMQTPLPPSTRPNARTTALRKYMAEQTSPFYLLDQKITTMLFSLLVTHYGFTAATKFFREGFLQFSGHARQTFSQQMNTIDTWVNGEFKRIQDASAGKQILLFNNRVAAGCNDDQDLGREAIRNIEATLTRENVFHWYLIADSRAYRDPKSNKTYLFSDGDSSWDNNGLYKLRHILLLIKLLQLPNLIGLAGNTSGTLDIAAFVGHRVYGFHTFTTTRGNLYLDAQDYRMVMQHSFMSVGLPIGNSTSQPVDRNGDFFSQWLRNNPQNRMPSLPGRVIGIASCKTDLKYASHQDRLPFSGSLTWPTPNDSRNLAPLPQLEKIVTKPRLSVNSKFKQMDEQLRAAIAPAPAFTGQDVGATRSRPL